MGLSLSQVEEVVELALNEDVGSGDVTTQLTVPEDMVATGSIIAKQEGVLAGVDVASLVFQKVDPDLKLIHKFKDGDRIAQGDVLAEVTGPVRGILSGERVALNFLQRLSGIATLTARFVEAVSGTKAKVVDTRKTTPGLRGLEKYAVKVGGGENHRFGLYDGVLIKENHIAAAGGISEAVRRVKEARANFKVEVEAKDLDQAQEAASLGVDRIMLDNLAMAEMRKAVGLIRRRSALDGRPVEVEASGGISLENVHQVAGAGVDYISVGALTHSAPALDMSLMFVKIPGVWSSFR